MSFLISNANNQGTIQIECFDSDFSFGSQPRRQDFETSGEGETIIVPDVETKICSGCKEMV